MDRNQIFVQLLSNLCPVFGVQLLSNTNICPDFVLIKGILEWVMGGLWAVGRGPWPIFEPETLSLVCLEIVQQPMSKVCPFFVQMQGDQVVNEKI